MFTKGEILSTVELASRMGYTYGSFRVKRQSCLTRLREFVDFDIIMQGQQQHYHILEVLRPYVKMPQKKTYEHNLNIYESNLIELIKDNPVGNAKSYSELIADRKEIQELNHADSTVYEYSRLVKKRAVGNKVGSIGNLGSVSHKVWCFREREEKQPYELMEEDEIKAFLELFKDERIEFIDHLSDRQDREISKRELQEVITENLYVAYVTAQERYKAIYGKTPCKIPFNRLNGFYIGEDNKYVLSPTSNN